MFSCLSLSLLLSVTKEVDTIITAIPSKDSHSAIQKMSLESSSVVRIRLLISLVSCSYVLSEHLLTLMLIQYQCEAVICDFNDSIFLVSGKFLV